MQDDDLIKIWNAIEVPEISDKEMLEMIKRKNQLFFRRAKKQLIFDGVLCSLLIVLYYAFYHAENNVLYAELFLISGLSLYILHDLLVFRFYDQPRRGNSVPEMGRIHKNRLKVMAIITAILRGIAAFVVIYVFSSAARVDAGRIWMTRASALVVVGQWVVIVRVWLNKLGIVLVKLARYHPINFLLDDDDGPSQGLGKWSRRR